MPEFSIWLTFRSKSVVCDPICVLTISQISESEMGSRLFIITLLVLRGRIRPKKHSFTRTEYVQKERPGRRHFHHSCRLTIRVALWPPKPRLLLTQALTCISRAL